jgi:hypothetical protein
MTAVDYLYTGFPVVMLASMNANPVAISLVAAMFHVDAKVPEAITPLTDMRLVEIVDVSSMMVLV